MRLVLQRSARDCGIAALATLLEQSYEDTYVAVTAVESTARGKQGLTLEHIIAAARAFGVRLRRKLHPSLDDDEGILVVNWRVPSAHPIASHVVVLAYGVIADPADGLILPAEDYLVREDARAGSLLEIP